MKKYFLIPFFTIILFSTSCHNLGDGSKTEMLQLSQDNWRLNQEEISICELSLPELFNGYTYQDSLNIALSNIENPSYELVWGEPTVVSPNKEYAVYISNKADLISGNFSIMLFNTISNEEIVLIDLKSQIPAYPLWWIDNKRFVYEYDENYYVCDIESPSDSSKLTLYGDHSTILAYDLDTVMYIENEYEPEHATRQIAEITDDNRCKNIATFTDDQGMLMLESALSDTLHLVAMKGRVSEDSGARYVIIFDYEQNKYAKLPPPQINNAQTINAIDFSWQGGDLMVRYNVDGIEQEWIYRF